jgi:hypothetical protein
MFSSVGLVALINMILVAVVVVAQWQWSVNSECLMQFIYRHLILKMKFLAQPRFSRIKIFKNQYY